MEINDLMPYEDKIISVDRSKAIGALALSAMLGFLGFGIGKINDVRMRAQQELRPVPIAYNVHQENKLEKFLRDITRTEQASLQKSYSKNLELRTADNLTLQEKAYLDLLHQNQRLFSAADRASAKSGIDRLLLYAMPIRETAVTKLYQNGKSEKDVGHKFESQAGARGPMGITKAALADYNKMHQKSTFTFDGMFDYDKNFEVGTWHLKKLMEKYKGNLPIALLAYNVGEKNVDELIKKAETDEFSAILARYDRPLRRGSEKYRQPRDYAGIILGIMRILDGVARKTEENHAHSALIKVYLADAKRYPHTEPVRTSKTFIKNPYLIAPYKEAKQIQ